MFRGLVFTNTHENARAVDVRASGGVVSVDRGQIVTFTGNENGNAFSTNGGTLTFAGEGNFILSGDNGIISGGARVLKTGEGTVEFSGNNSYTGGTTISGGTLVVKHANALGTGNVTVGTGTKLLLGSDVSVKNLGGNGGVKLADGTQSATITAAYDTDTVLSADINAGVHTNGVWKDNDTSINFIKKGDATLVLTKLNTFFGDVHVEAGTLHAAASTTLGGADVVVKNGASLKVNPTVGEYGVYAASYNFESGSKLVIDLANVPVVADLATEANPIVLGIITATVSDIAFGGEVVEVGDAFALPSGYVVFENDALSEYTKRTWSFDGYNLYLTLAIPEPSLFGVLAGLGALALVGTRRRRKKA